MKVSELIERLKAMPQDVDACYGESLDSCYDIGTVEHFDEEINGRLTNQPVRMNVVLIS